MPVPFREWFLFQHIAMHRSSADNSEDRPHWLAGRLEWGQGGQYSEVGPIYHDYKTLVRPLHNFEEDPVNLNLLVDFEIDVEVSQKTLIGGTSHCHIDFGAQAKPPSPLIWDSELADGVFHDGILPWCLLAEIPFYPEGNAWSTHLRQINVPLTSPTTYREYGCSYKMGLGPEVWISRAQYEKEGLCFEFVSWSPADPIPAGEQCLFNLKLKKLRFLYLNPVVNSLSGYSMPPAGGIALVLSGLGFNNTDTEVSDTVKNPNNSVPPAGGWNDNVQHIHFIGLQGQGTTILDRGAGDFTVDSNSQITIPVMPAMGEGTYEIYLIKDQLNIGGGFGGFGPGYAYAGDWRTEAGGRLYRGSRITFIVGDPGPGKKRPVIFSKWRFKKWGGGIDRYYAPIDITTPAIFYDGRILGASPVTRAISDKGGLFTSSDMDVALANPDKEFSKLLAEYFLKNQIVEFYYGWADQPESWKTASSVLIVDDYNRPGSVFKVKLRDITTKYFKRKIPLYRITEAEYPNAHKNALNKPMPDVIGLASYTETGLGGAVEAFCVDTITFKYLAARGSLISVDQVYKDGVLWPGANYAVSYADGGRTYITFTTDMEDSKITFNAKGYSFAPWDSASGYVQNPAYILGFFLAFLVEVPEDFIDFDSLDALAAKFVLEGEGTSGFLILQREHDSETILEELLYTMGAQSAFDRTGRFYVERKDLSVAATNLFIFTQIDALNQPDFQHNLKSAINRARYRWTHNPAADLYAGGAEATRPSSISDFEEELESPDFIDFKWTTSAAWAAKRAEEELLKWGYGQPKITFDLPLAWIDDLDVLTNFRLQDPFGLSLTGSGEQGRYCYVTSFTADYLGAKLGIEAGDLSWILRQYLFLGDENDLPASWTNATAEQRVWAYLCDEITGRFADGEIGKKLADENMI